jgi:hypothetical protein
MKNSLEMIEGLWYTLRMFGVASMKPWLETAPAQHRFCRKRIIRLHSVVAEKRPRYGRSGPQRRIQRQIWRLCFTKVMGAKQRDPNLGRIMQELMVTNGVVSFWMNSNQVWMVRNVQLYPRSFIDPADS